MSDHQPQPIAPGEFAGGLFNCGGVGPCLGAFFCTPCLYGRVVHRLRHFPQTPEQSSFSYLNADCGVFWCVQACTGCGFILSMMKRGEQRDKFGIRGDGMRDCLVSCCCTPCGIAQANLDLKRRAELTTPMVDANGAPNETYEKQETGMVYQAPAQKQ